MPKPDHDDPAALKAELAAARAELSLLRDRLAVAQRFGRLGTWERDLSDGRGHWDAPALRIWGLPADSTTLSADDMAARIVDTDRAAATRYYADSMQRVGGYAFRFSLCTPAGQLRRVHAQWEVKAGPDGRPARMVGVLIDETDPLAADDTVTPLLSQLSLAVELGNILIWRHDLDNGRMHWNAAGWHTLGLEPRPEGLPIDEVRSLVHPDDLPKVVASAQQALAGPAPVDLEARYRHADGSWRTQLLRRSVLRDADGRPVAFLGVALDITERRAEQRRAEAMARRFEAVTRTAGIGYWANDLTRGRIEWNSETCRMHGLAADEAPPSTREWLEHWVHPEDRAAVRDAILVRLPGAGERGLDLSLRIVRRDGELRQLASHTRIEHGAEGDLIFGVLIDMTERLRSESELRGAEARIALALRGAGIGTWERDMDTGHTHWDDQMWRLRGREPEPRAPTAERVFGWVVPEDLERNLAAYREAERLGQPLDHEFRVVLPDGSVRWLASRASEVAGANGHRLRIGVNWDITAARSAERARQDMELAQRESRAKSQFLARMSHELRTPLNAVLGFTQLMLADEAGADEPALLRRRRLDHVAAAGTHLLQLIDDVLTLSGAEGGELRFAPQPVALCRAASEVIAMLAASAEARGIRIDCGEGTLAVWADPTRLRQVLLNLIGNAVKYNRDGGRVELRAERSGEQVRLRIIDTGPGLSEEQQRHLFEPFNRLGAEGGAVEGHGIGLAIVKALVERMGGRVWADSRPGEGSVFHVELPAAEAADDDHAEPAPVADAPRAAAGSGARRRLLYIEDNPVNAMIIRELVAGRSDLELAEAANGLQGLAAVQQLRPALVLLDMQLPDIDGLEVLQRLKADAETAAIPVIALSANAMPEDIRRTLDAGASAYWTKPLDFAVFRAGLASVFGPAPG